jgi:rod shape-determining protein MreD
VALDALKAALLVFVAAVVQVTIFSTLDVLGGTADLLLVTLAMIALLRGSIVGAVAGFWAGLLFDTAMLQTLGLSSLLYTLAGYWIGRYGETTGRGRAHAPMLSVAVITVLYAAAAFVLHFMLGDPVDGGEVLFDSLLPGILLNLLLAMPVFALGRRFFRPTKSRVPEVQLLVER